MKFILVSALVLFSFAGVANAGVDYTQSFCEGPTATQLSTGLEFQLPCDKYGELEIVDEAVLPEGEMTPEQMAQYEPANPFGTSEAEDAAIIRLYEAFGEQAIGIVVMQTRDACQRIETVGLPCAAQDDATEGAQVMMVARFGSIPTSLAALGQ